MDKITKAEQAAVTLSEVVNDYDGEGIRIVFDKMMNQHRTLQQMFTNRFIIPYIRQMAERCDIGQYDLRNKAACKACKDMWEGLKQARGITDDDAVNLPMI
jgi:hypothetical protein